MPQYKAEASQLAQGSAYARCKELELENVLSKVDMMDRKGRTKLWLSKRPQNDAAVLLQRCVFDVDGPLIQSCPSCRKISEATSPIFTFQADPDGDTSTHRGTSFTTNDSWLCYGTAYYYERNCISICGRATSLMGGSFLLQHNSLKCRLVLSIITLGKSRMSSAYV